MINFNLVLIFLITFLVTQIEVYLNTGVPLLSISGVIGPAFITFGVWCVGEFFRGLKKMDYVTGLESLYVPYWIYEESEEEN